MEQHVIEKVGDLEDRIEAHISKIESKLERIAEIMESVSVLKERDTRNSTDIQELKNSIKRLHERIEINDSEQRLCEKTHGNSIHEVETKFNSSLELFKEKARELNKDIDTRITAIDSKLSSWSNRAVGVWGTASVLLIFINTIGGFLVNSIKDDYSSLKSQVTELQKHQNETDNNTTMLWNAIRSSTSKGGSDSRGN